MRKAVLKPERNRDQASRNERSVVGTYVEAQSRTMSSWYI